MFSLCLTVSLPAPADTPTEVNRPPPQVRKYIVSEREKFGRELSLEEGQAEVDKWLLKQVFCQSF